MADDKCVVQIAGDVMEGIATDDRDIAIMFGLIAGFFVFLGAAIISAGAVG